MIEIILSEARIGEDVSRFSQEIPRDPWLLTLCPEGELCWMCAHIQKEIEGGREREREMLLLRE